MAGCARHHLRAKDVPATKPMVRIMDTLQRAGVRPRGPVGAARAVDHVGSDGAGWLTRFRPQDAAGWEALAAAMALFILVAGGCWQVCAGEIQPHPCRSRNVDRVPQG